MAAAAGAPQRWEIVGGEGEIGGLLVREGKDLKSTACEQRLSHKALVLQQALEKDRLHYRLLEGTGPPEGWITVKTKDKILALVTDREPGVPASEDALPSAAPASVGETLKPSADEASKSVVDEALKASVETAARAAAGSKAIEDWCMKYKVFGYPLAPGTCKFRVFCFHGAGSAESVFTGPAMNPFLTWAKETKAVEIVAPSYPGRDKLRDRRPHEDTESLVRDMLPVFYDLLNDGVPFAFWGHSVGTWVAFEMLQLMRKVGLPMPVVCFLNAFCAPHLDDSTRPWRVNRSISDSDMKEELMNWDAGHFNGRGKMVYDEPEWTKTWLPLMRSDFRLFDEYKLRHDRQDKFDFPIHCIFFSGEHFVKAEWVHMWQDWTTAPCTVETQNAGHLTCVYEPAKKKVYFQKALDVIKPFAGC